MNCTADRIVWKPRFTGPLQSIVGVLLSAALLLAINQAHAEEPKNNSDTGTSDRHRVVPQATPQPLPGHPGNIFLAGEAVHIPVPETVNTGCTQWRLMDDRRQTVRLAKLPSPPAEPRQVIDLGKLDPGWYRIEFGSAQQPDQTWTSLAVLPRLVTPTPLDTPVAVDAAIAWFARDDPGKQKKFANLAALAGVRWVRDRLRWSEIQPHAGALQPPPTTYDTSADASHEEGLRVLQVFHDTPPWARENADAGGRFAPDLRNIYRFGRELALRFQGRIEAWEPWNEANIATFGAHTVDQMCSWQKAAWLGFKSGDPDVLVGWNVSAAIPTPAQTEGVLANETWPYFDTYNIHTYDWPHSYAELWQPARAAASGRPLWITEADRGTPHLKNPPWYDQDPRLEQLKAEWIAQSFACSLFAGAQRHFQFILGNYQEGNHIQFGLLRHDLTPRPAYVALAAVGRCLAGARALGRWQPGQHVQVYAFRARPDGREHDVLVAWAEKEVDWNERGVTTADWKLPANLAVQEVVDYLGRSRGTKFPSPLTSAPVFVFLPPGEAAKLPLETPPPSAPRRPGVPSPVVLQLVLPQSATRKVEDLQWSEGYVYQATPNQPLDFKLHVYNFGTNTAAGRLQFTRQPPQWEVKLATANFNVAPMDRAELTGTLRIPKDATVQDGWVAIRADGGPAGQPVLAFRVVTAK